MKELIDCWEEKMTSFLGTQIKIEWLEIFSEEHKNLPAIDISVKTVSSHQLISWWKMVQMPGCCGILISTGVYVDKDYRNKGINKVLNQFRIQVAKKLGYGILLCTDVKSNIPQQKTLEANGWENLFEFKNPRTKNIVNIHAIKV